MKNVLSRLMGLVAAMVLMVSVHLSFGDVVHLKDGTAIEGQIEREIEGSVWIKTSIGGIESVRFILGENISRIERTSKPAEAAPAKDPGAQSDPKPRRGGVPRGTVISLEGTVGIQMTAKSLEDLIPLLEREIGNDGTGIVVFKINSGGGLLLEIQKLSDVIHNEYKPRFRTVSWIDSAISAAAMTSHCVEEIYFLPEGNYGACTGWSGALKAVEGEGLENVLYMMEKISARGGYDPYIMRAMQINGAPLSCTIDSRTGQVSWYQTEEGQYLVSKGDSILTFTAPEALRYKFSKGTAANLDELTRALGYQEVEWVGENRPGFIYPISKSENTILTYRERVTEDENRTREYFGNYQQARAAAAAAQGDLRPRFVGRARQHLKRIESMVRNNPNFTLLIFGMELKDWERDWLKPEEKYLADLLKN